MPFAAIPFPVIDPILIQIGPLAIRWYAMAYIFGIIIGWLYARRIVANNNLWGSPGSPISRKRIDDFVVFATIGIIIGGRLGYVDDGNTPNTQVSVYHYGEQQLIFEVRGLKTSPYKTAKIGVIFHCDEGYLVSASYSKLPWAMGVQYRQRMRTQVQATWELRRCRYRPAPLFPFRTLRCCYHLSVP